MTAALEMFGSTLFNNGMSASDVESVVRQLHGLVPKWCDGALLLNGTVGCGTNIESGITCGLEDEFSNICAPCKYAIFALDSWHYKAKKHVTPGIARSLGIQFLNGMTHHQTSNSGECSEFVTIRGIYVWARSGGATIKGHQLDTLHRNKQHMDRLSRCGAFDGAISLARRYDWTVELSIDGAPSMSFACTPSAARAAYRLRDLPAGKSRREALLHWVSAHKRRDEIDVSEHLRGKIEFSWRGIGCKIMPSQFDREKELLRKSLSGARP